LDPALVELPDGDVVVPFPLPLPPPLDVETVLDVVPGLAGLEDEVGGVVTTEVAGCDTVGGEVGGGITPELEAACARTPDTLKSKKLKKRANKVRHDAIANKRSPEKRR